MKNLFSKIKTILSKAFGSFLGFLVERGQIAVKVTDIVKAIVENPLLSIAVELTPTKADDAVLAKAKEIFSISVSFDFMFFSFGFRIYNDICHIDLWK